MLMGDSTIKIVHVGGSLMIGSLEGNDLISPRVISIEQAPAGMMIRFLQLVGAPKQISLGPMAFSYATEDEGLVNAYRESVTGLVMAKAGDAAALRPSNVIPMGGRK